MDKITVDSLKCPICMEIPTAEIFQCKLGHSLCSKCSDKLTNCPNCRVEFETPLIRNYFAENILDSLKFDCEFKEQGCTSKHSRGQLLFHSKLCKFGGTRINLCQLLGFSCEFLTSERDLSGMATHYANAHHAVAIIDQKVKLPFHDFAEVLRNAETQLFWQPLAFVTAEELTRILLLQISCNRETKSMVFNCIQIQEDNFTKPIVDSENYILDFAIKSPNLIELPELVWYVPAYQLTHAEFAIKNMGFSLQYDLLPAYCTENGSLYINCSIRKKLEQDEDNNMFIEISSLPILTHAWTHKPTCSGVAD